MSRINSHLYITDHFFFFFFLRKLTYKEALSVVFWFQRETEHFFSNIKYILKTTLRVPFSFVEVSYVICLFANSSHNLKRETL